MTLVFSYTFGYTKVNPKISNLIKLSSYIVSSSLVGPFIEIALGGLFYCLSLMRFRYYILSIIQPNFLH